MKCLISRLALYKRQNKILKREIKNTEEKYSILEKNNIELIQIAKNFNLICTALNAKRLDSKFIPVFEELLNNDFKKILCEKVPGVNDAETMEKLNYVFNQMKSISGCPELHSKRIGAIGGGFSSGKSSFINSFLDNSKVKLAEGINPVTVIPSYVLCDKKSEIKGVNYKNRYFNIEPEMYEMLKHDYVKKAFPFELNRLIFYTTVLTPMVTEYFKHLCLIDTPGYNPPSSRNTKHDFENAKLYIKDAKFLIWIVDIEKGTFPKSDIEFLRELDMFGMKPDLPLYIVINKCHLRPPDNVENVLNNIADVLDDNDIYYEGISAYDTQIKKQYYFKKKDIFDFLKEHNKPSDKYNELKSILFNVFSHYVREVNRVHDEKEKNRIKVNSIILDALQSRNIGIDKEASGKMEDGLNELLHYFQSKEEFNKNHELVITIREKFFKCLDNFCDSMGIERKNNYFCLECGEIVEKKDSLCKKCSSMKKCPKCNIKYPANEKFCLECGGKLK